MSARPVILYCRACDAGFGSTGAVPPICPRCDSPDPKWTTTPPYKLTVMDRRFLRLNRIDPD